MINLIPECTVNHTITASALNHQHIGEDIGFSFIDPISRIHTLVIGELRSIYHTADSVTLDLAPLEDHVYKLKEFEELPLDTAIYLITVNQKGH